MTTTPLLVGGLAGAKAPAFFLPRRVSCAARQARNNCPASGFASITSRPFLRSACASARACARASALVFLFQRAAMLHAQINDDCGVESRHASRVNPKGDSWGHRVEVTGGRRIKRRNEFPSNRRQTSTADPHRAGVAHGQSSPIFFASSGLIGNFSALSMLCIFADRSKQTKARGRE